MRQGCKVTVKLFLGMKRKKTFKYVILVIKDEF